MFWGIKSALDLVRAQRAEQVDAKFLAHIPIDLGMAPKYAEGLQTGNAQAAVLWEGADWQSFGLKAAIFAPRPRMTLSGVTAMLDRGQGIPPGIHPSAVIDPAADIGEDVTVGPLAVIGAGAKIGARSVIGPHCYIGTDVVIGEDAILREMVSVGARAIIGKRFRAQPGARVGGDGFSYVTPEVSGAENARKTLGDQGEAKAQAWVRIHSLGAVTIGDDVEIGSNCTLDNGTIRDTVIGSGSKLDNLVHGAAQFQQLFLAARDLARLQIGYMADGEEFQHFIGLGP